MNDEANHLQRVWPIVMQKVTVAITGVAMPEHMSPTELLSKQAELLPRGLYGYGREGDWLQTKQVTSHSTSTRAGRSGKKQGSIPSGDIRLRGADKLGSTTKGRPAAKAASGNTELLQEMGVARSCIFAFTGCCGSGK